MRFILFAVSFIVTVALIYILDTRAVLPAPLGKLLSPQEGIWQNAEPMNASFDDEISFPDLEGKVEVFFDDRLIPHVFAEKENDAYFVQGFLHAKFRLWQMEFQTHATAGRISEIIGDRAVNYDRAQRRKGLVFGAEQTLKAMEADPEVKAAIDAYSNGINAYISSIKTAELPVEYKLLGYKPEKWNNLKTALFIKAMTNDLSGHDNDFEYTNALSFLGEENFRLLYPEIADSLMPVIPKGTYFDPPSEIISPPLNADSAYFHRDSTIPVMDMSKPNPANGSNNWAISGAKTQSGKPILCNDPHLSLTLPAIWFEMQIHTPAYNSYGVSFPGIPGIVIGFNEHIAFGFTNSGRDVKDYYEIRFRDESRQEYYFNNKWVSTRNRIEIIKINGKQDVLDTVSYTVFGPVIYDGSSPSKLNNGKAYALRWVAHDSANMLKTWYLLNRAQNYDQYLEAIKNFNVPGQNILFASKTGDIALWQQASFPLRWKGQGLFVMPGTDSSYMWKGFIPQEHNPHILNPAEGYISSANQRPVDSTYPYFIPGSYDVYRGIIINRRLKGLNDQVTPEDMMKLQNDNYNVFAEYARPILIDNLQAGSMDGKEEEYLSILKNWNLNNNPEEKGATIFKAWWDSLAMAVYSDDMRQTDMPVVYPEKFVLLEGLLRDSIYRFTDNINTNEKESLPQMVTAAFRRATVALKQLENEGRLEWGKFKNTTIYHLLKDAAKPFARPGLLNGGGYGIINATQHDHGPSWRMVVHLTTPVEAYVVYPGGQSGNPGSRYYDNFVDKWTKGEYYAAWVMAASEKSDPRVKWKMIFKP